ncbi:MAG: S1C family serine protease, partial [Pyrinomonadaceae bacterium]
VFGGELLAPGQIEQWRDHGEKLGRELKELGREGGSFFSLGFGPGRRIGVTTSGLTDQLAEYFGVERGGGVLVTSVRADSPAAKAGLRAGDVITAVDGERVTRAGELSRALGRKSEGEVTLTVVRDKNSRPVKVTPERVETPQFEIFTDTFAPRAVAAAPPLPPRVTVRPRVTAPPRSLLPLRPLILRRGPSTLLD